MWSYYNVFSVFRNTFRFFVKYKFKIKNFSTVYFHSKLNLFRAMNIYSNINANPVLDGLFYGREMNGT